MGQLNLQTVIDSNSGFCFGVVEAINKAEQAINKGVELYCLGEIVHNDEEVNRLSKRGMKTINHDDLAKLSNKTILFRAHGEHPRSYRIANDKNNTIIDASCPIIKKLQQKVKASYQNNEFIVIFGKPAHPEIIALNGQIDNNALIIESIDDIDIEKLPQNITIYSQTTRSIDAFYEIVEYLKNAGKKLIVKDTICRRVSNRHPLLKEFCSKYSKVIFVGGKKSSNARVLFDVCNTVNKKAYFISRPEEIDPGWFEPNDIVGITGATSTPHWLMEKVSAYLKEL
ncbi:MAG: 4-hydroxy-3-methylbut-2-enyl diphosphate reductase [Bacteroidales bacterium]